MTVKLEIDRVAEKINDSTSKILATLNSLDEMHANKTYEIPAEEELQKIRSNFEDLQLSNKEGALKELNNWMKMRKTYYHEDDAEYIKNIENLHRSFADSLTPTLQNLFKEINNYDNKLHACLDDVNALSLELFEYYEATKSHDTEEIKFPDLVLADKAVEGQLSSYSRETLIEQLTQMQKREKYFLEILESLRMTVKKVQTDLESSLAHEKEIQNALDATKTSLDQMTDKSIELEKTVALFQSKEEARIKMWENVRIANQEPYMVGQVFVSPKIDVSDEINEYEIPFEEISHDYGVYNEDIFDINTEHNEIEVQTDPVEFVTENEINHEEEIKKELELNANKDSDDRKKGIIDSESEKQLPKLKSNNSSEVEKEITYYRPDVDMEVSPVVELHIALISEPDFNYSSENSRPNHRRTSNAQNMAVSRGITLQDGSKNSFNNQVLNENQNNSNSNLVNNDNYINSSSSRSSMINSNANTSNKSLHQLEKENQQLSSISEESGGNEYSKKVILPNHNNTNYVSSSISNPRTNQIHRNNNNNRNVQKSEIYDEYAAEDSFASSESSESQFQDKLIRSQQDLVFNNEGVFVEPRSFEAEDAHDVLRINTNISPVDDPSRPQTVRNITTNPLVRYNFDDQNCQNQQQNEKETPKTAQNRPRSPIIDFWKSQPKKGWRVGQPYYSAAFRQRMLRIAAMRSGYTQRSSVKVNFVPFGQSQRNEIEGEQIHKSPVSPRRDERGYLPSYPGIMRPNVIGSEVGRKDRGLGLYISSFNFNRK